MTLHLFGTKHHKPISPITPTDTPTDKEPSKKLAKKTEELHEKAMQPHSHYERAAREHQKENDAALAEMSEGAREAALAAARGGSKA